MFIWHAIIFSVFCLHINRYWNEKKKKLIYFRKKKMGKEKKTPPPGIELGPVDSESDALITVLPRCL